MIFNKGGGDSAPLPHPPPPWIRLWVCGFGDFFHVTSTCQVSVAQSVRAFGLYEDSYGNVSYELEMVTFIVVYVIIIIIIIKIVIIFIIITIFIIIIIIIILVLSLILLSLVLLLSLLFSYYFKYNGDINF